MIYLATQYSHPDPLVRKTRYLLAMEVAAALIKEKHVIYSPIVHCHEMADRHGFPTDAKWWEEYNNSFIRHCDAVWVLVTPELHTSKGVMAEIEFAKACFIPIVFIDSKLSIIEWAPPAREMSY